MLEQRFHHLRVIFGGGPHDGGLTAMFFGIHLGARFEQGADGFETAGPCGGHQSGFPPGSRTVRIGARLQKKSDQFGLPVGAGE